MEIIEETTAAMVARQAAEVVLPYLRAFDLWRRHTDLRDPDEPAFQASRTALLRVAGEQGCRLHRCLEEIRPRLARVFDAGGAHGSGEDVDGAAFKHHHAMHIVHEEWGSALVCLCNVHHSKVLGARRRPAVTLDGPESSSCTSGAGTTMAWGVKYRLYSLRNALELRALRPYWTTAVLDAASDGVEQDVADSHWDALEAKMAAPVSVIGTHEGAHHDSGNGGGDREGYSGDVDSDGCSQQAQDSRAPPSGRPCAVGVMHHQQGGLLQRRWSLYIPETYHEEEVAEQVPPSMALVLALHGAKTTWCARTMDATPLVSRST
jgi:hypothetical protein